MDIWEKIFARLDEIHISQVELSRKTGIATSTISDWKKKHINPQADKLVPICKALDLSLVDLLCDDSKHDSTGLSVDGIINGDLIIQQLNELPSSSRRRILSYIDRLTYCRDHNILHDNIDIIFDAEGNRIVVINDLRFKGRRSIDWNIVESCLKEYIGYCTEILETGKMIFIGSDFPDEYVHSKDTKVLQGANEYAKANASAVIPELIQIATNESFAANYEKKHNKDAKHGWYRYDTRFAIPRYDNDGEMTGYNIYNGRLVIRHADDGKLYLYDVVRIKKETSGPPG